MLGDPSKWLRGRALICLVVGGGFLGAHVAERLAARGDDVIVYSRSFSDWLVREDRSVRGTIALTSGEVPPGIGLQELIAEAEVVYYLAGSGTPVGAKTDPGGSIVTSVVPAAAVLDLMTTTSTRRIVVASSGGTVYGKAAQLPTNEEQPTRPISIHGHNSLSIERYALFYADQFGLEPIILRYANPYGPGQVARRGQGVIAAWCEAVYRRQKIVVYGSLANRRDFLYVSDAADATIYASSEASRPGIYNVGSGSSYALSDVLNIIQRIAGEEVVVEREPPRGVDVPNTQLDCTLIRESTGWRPRISLELGLEATMRWTMSRTAPGRS